MTHYNYDKATINARIESGDQVELLSIRAELVEFKKDLESQIADGKADFVDERSRFMQRGVHPIEASYRASAENSDWRARATNLSRMVDAQLGKIRARLSQIANKDPKRAPLQAVSIAGVSSSMQVTAALNELLTCGCKVHAFAVVGGDLVVVASEPSK